MFGGRLLRERRERRRLGTPDITSSAEIPFNRDVTGRLLPWMIAPMICLTILSAAGAVMLTRGLAGMTAGVAGSVTVHLPTGSLTATQADESAQRAANILKRQTGVARVRVLGRAQVASLINKWTGGDVRGLPLPRLLDVTLQPGAGPNLSAMQRVMQSIVTGASVVDHRRFLGTYLGVSQWVFIGGLAVALFVLGAAMLTINFATRTSLRIHREIIDVLSIVGAADRQVAEQFGRFAFRQGLLGGVMGAATAAAMVFMLVFVAGDGTIGGARQLTERLAPWWLWLIIVLSPVVTAILSRITARITAMRALARSF